MRVAYVCADGGVPIYGHKGCSIHVQEFVRALLRQGADVRLYSPRLGGDPNTGLEQLKVCEFPLKRKGGVAEREQAALAANDHVRRLLERDGPFDLVYERYSLFGYGAMEYARAAGTPAVLEVNAPLIEEQSQYRALIDRAGAETASRRAFRAASLLAAVSEEVAAYLERFPEALGRVHVVTNGVDPNRFRPKLVADPSPSKPFTVGFVGSLKPWHGLLNLVEAFSALTARAANARLLVIGDGPERQRLEAATRDRALSGAVHFTGAVSHEEVPALLDSLDVAVAPYPDLPTFYFSPLKIYEYMAAGRAVVASRTGQVAKLIEHGVTGLLYEPGNIRALFEALDRLRCDHDLRLALGNSARKVIVNGHTWDATVTRVLRLGRLDTSTLQPNTSA